MNRLSTPPLFPALLPSLQFSVSNSKPCVWTALILSTGTEITPQCLQRMNSVHPTSGSSLHPTSAWERDRRAALPSPYPMSHFSMPCDLWPMAQAKSSIICLNFIQMTLGAAEGFMLRHEDLELTLWSSQGPKKWRYSFVPQTLVTLTQALLSTGYESQLWALVCPS